MTVASIIVVFHEGNILESIQIKVKEKHRELMQEAQMNL